MTKFERNIPTIGPNIDKLYDSARDGNFDLLSLKRAWVFFWRIDIERGMIFADPGNQDELDALRVMGEDLRQTRQSAVLGKDDDGNADHALLVNPNNVIGVAKNLQQRLGTKPKFVRKK